MELELNQAHVKHYAMLHNICISQEEMQESIVPDAYPDMLRIVEAGGQLCLCEKEMQEGCVSASGTIFGWLLYQPENGESLCKIDFSIPYTAKTDTPGSTSSGCCIVRPVLCRVDARMLNPRKVLLRADICIEVRLYEPCVLSICSGIVCSEQAGVQQRLQEQQSYLTTAVKEKAFSVYEEVHAPVGIDGGGAVLCVSAEAHCSEAKIIGGKLIFKGEAVVRFRSFVDGQMSSAAIPVSFSQIMEVEEVGDQADCTVNMYVVNVTCDRVGEDGRVLALSLDLVGQGVVAEKRSITMLQDAYSTCGELPVELQSVYITDLLEQYTKPQNLRELLETEVQAKRIVDAVVRVCNVSTAGTMVQTQLQADVMYVDDNDKLYSVSRTFYHSKQLELPEGGSCYMCCSSPGEAFAAITTGGIEIRFNLEYCGFVTRSESVVNVKNVRWVERNMDVTEFRPSIVMRAAMPGECLWDIAKAYRTTMSRICQANDFEQDEPLVGRMLLIPANR